MALTYLVDSYRDVSRLFYRSILAGIRVSTDIYFLRTDRWRWHGRGDICSQHPCNGDHDLFKPVGFGHGAT